MAREHVLGDISKGIVSEALPPAAGATIGLANSGKVVVRVIAGLIVRAVER